jgi:DNA-binding winged helix-turn-helix (wHTH) protein
MNDGGIEFGQFRLNLERRELSRAGVPIKLGSRAMDVLAILGNAGPGDRRRRRRHAHQA